MCALGDREVDPNLLSVQVDAVHLAAGLLRVLVRFKVDESKATAASRVTVKHNLHLLQVTKPAEFLLQLPLGGVEAEAEHPEALGGLRVLPVAQVPAPVRHGRTRVLTPTPVSPGPGTRACPGASATRTRPASGTHLNLI